MVKSLRGTYSPFTSSDQKQDMNWGV